MGKRKHNEVSYWQCDWTGMPLGCNKYYIPVLDASNKVSRRGTYLNWQCARAHLTFLHTSGKFTNDMYMFAKDHMDKGAGYEVRNAPDYQTLMHFGGKMTILDFVHDCNTRYEPLSAVKICTNGSMCEVEIKAIMGSYDSGICKEMESTHYEIFRPTRKLKTHKDKQLAVAVGRDEMGQASMVPNVKASQLFKIELTGDVLVICETKRIDVDVHTEYLPFKMFDFNEQFSKRKKKRHEDHTDTQSLSKEAYSIMQTDMNEAFKTIEAKHSKGALHPSKTARDARQPPPLARQMGSMATMQAGIEVA